MERDSTAAAAAATVYDDDEWTTEDLEAIMIPNFQSQLSPTTGAYYSMPIENDVDDSMYTNQHLGTGDLDPNSLTHFYGLQNQDIEAAFPIQQELLDFEIPLIPSDVTFRNISDDCLNADFRSCTDMNEFFNTLPGDNNIGAAFPIQQQLLDFETPSDFTFRNINGDCLNADFHSCTDMNEFYNILPGDNTRLYTNHTSYRNEDNQHVMENEPRVSIPVIETLDASEDGYDWRKYGQKQVKGSECPRSYFKCTHPNCEAKRKVERTLTGNVTQIIYKGKHNHPMPHPNRLYVSDEGATGEDNNSHAKSKDGSVSINMNSFSEDDRVASINWSCAGLDTELAESVRNQLSIENPPGNENVSSPPHCQNADDEDIDETGGKRRRTDDDLMVEPNMSFSGFRDEKITIQTESVLDIIDDGYRWRKYGQKVVKGNPNPRSYYKCTSPGCLVKKHVERNPQNIKEVNTTYEGKHNHEVPPAKNSSSSNKNVANLPSVPFTGQSSHISLTRSSTLPNIEMPDHFSPHFERTSFPGQHFERTSFPGNELLCPSLIGNFGTGMNFGSSSVYNSDFQMPCRSLVQNIPNFDIPQAGMTSSHASDLVNQPLLPTLPGSLNSNMTPDFYVSTEVTDELAHHPGNVSDVMRPNNESSSLPPIYGQGFPS